MKLHIHSGLNLADLKAAFSEHFSNLRLEFYAKGHSVGEGSSPKTALGNDLTIGQVATKAHEGDLYIFPEHTCAQVEKLFEEHYGLHAQILRKSGRTWLQTTKTDHWTLAEQQAHHENIQQAYENLEEEKGANQEWE